MSNNLNINEVTKYLNKIACEINNLKSFDENSMMFSCIFDYIYEKEVKPMWDGGFLKNFLIDYKTGLVSITPKQALRAIEVDIDVE